MVVLRLKPSPSVGVAISKVFETYFLVVVLKRVGIIDFLDIVLACRYIREDIR